MASVQRAHTRTTRERLLHDYYTTCTDTDIDRYRHTHTHNTHTQHTHTQHTHTTQEAANYVAEGCVVQQEAANYVAAEVHRAARSSELRSCRPKVTGGKGSGSRL
jgi:hypothetical protein